MSTATASDSRLSIGANGPPPPTLFEQSRDEIEGLCEEARHWLDGDGVNTPEQEKAVEKLLDMVRAALKSADASRKIENEPFDKGKAEVQSRYNPILARGNLAADTCKKALAPYRQRIADEKARAAETARQEAEAKRRAAEEAIRASRVDDLAKREEAEALLKEAQKSEKVARRADKTASTGLGLRTVWNTTLDDGGAAARHYWSCRRAEVEGFLLMLAKSDVAAGVRDIPGFTITAEKVAV